MFDNRREIMQDVFLTYLPAQRFKTSRMTVQLIAPLQRETAAANALLPAVLAAAAVVFLLSARGLPARDAVTADFGGIFRFDGQLTLTAAVLGGFLLLENMRFYLIDCRFDLYETTQINQSVGIKIRNADCTNPALFIGFLHRTVSTVVIVKGLMDQT